jgi:hypothetical protein
VSETGYLFERGPFVAAIPVKTGIQDLKKTGFLLFQE